jgi:hypothetical protein
VYASVFRTLSQLEVLQNMPGGEEERKVGDSGGGELNNAGLRSA